LQVLNHAVWDDHRVDLALRTRWSSDIEIEAEPHALVAKGGSWHAVLRSDGNWRAIRVRDVSHVVDTGETFARDPSFELHAFWDEWCEYLGRFEQRYRVVALVEPSALPEIRRRFGTRLAAARSPAGPARETRPVRAGGDEPRWTIDGEDAVVEGDGPSEARSVTPMSSRAGRRGWRLRIELSFDSLEAARDQLLPLGRGVEVVEPQALRLTIADYAGQIVDRYADERS
jgi:predicted DNA-binding transcriptional regulator YafY